MHDGFNQLYLKGHFLLHKPLKHGQQKLRVFQRSVLWSEAQKHGLGTLRESVLLNRMERTYRKLVRALAAATVTAGATAPDKEN